MNKELTCIICPIGCNLKINQIDDGCSYIIKGYKCKKGKIFAEEEVIDPRRIITTTIKIDSKKLNRLPVKTSKPVPKNEILNFVKEIKKIKTGPAIRMGDILSRNIFNSGVDIISCMTVTE